MSLFLDIVIIGILSCLMMDLWQKLLKLTYNINPSDWKIIGRWFIFVVLKNKIYNPNIENENPFKNELAIGWVFHYFIAIMYSLTFFILMNNFLIFKANWFDGLLFGLATLIIPWFFMLPVLGKGFMASKTPRPLFISSLSIWSHVVIGVSIGHFYYLLEY